MENQSQPNQEKKSNNNAFFITVILLLLISNGVLGYLFFEAKNHIEVKEVAIGDLTSERDQLEVDLEDMLGQYDDMQTNNDSLNADLEAQKEKIRGLLEQAKKHDNDEYIIYKLKKEAGTLRTIMKGYLVTIDSIHTLNQQLRIEKTEITGELNTQKQKYNELEDVNSSLEHQVKIGSRMKAMDIIMQALRVKGNNVVRETSKADKTQKIKACFTMDKNQIAEIGKKMIYLRVIAPNGNVLTFSDDESGQFEFNGSSGFFSAKKEVIWENDLLDVCMFYDVKQDLLAGVYLAEFYCDGADIGKTKVELK